MKWWKQIVDPDHTRRIAEATQLAAQVQNLAEQVRQLTSKGEEGDRDREH